MGRVAPSNVTEFGWALAGEDTLTGELECEARQLLGKVEHDPTALLDDIDLSESDRAVRGDPGFRETLGSATREMLAQGVWGWVDDDMAFIKPWGFDVTELRVPVEIRYGQRTCSCRPLTGNGWRHTSLVRQGSSTSMAGT